MTDRTRARTPWTGAAVAAFLITALAGCTSGDAQDRATSARRPAAAPTAELVALAGTRSSEATSLTLRATVTLGGEQVSELTSSSTADGSRVAVRADVAGLGGLESRVVDGTWYVSTGSAAAGSEWISVDPGSFGALVPVVGDLLGDDPRDLFDALSGVSSEVVEVGRDQVEGVPTTRYRMTVDGRELSTAMAPGGPSRTWGTVGLDVWIDDDGYVRRLRSELDDPAGGTEPYAFEATVLSYDAPVEVVPPPPQDTVSVEDLLAEDGLGSLAELLGGG